jgi:hypothetical protein
MPDEFKGKIMKRSQEKKSNPRRWTDKELEWCKSLREEGFNNKKIAQSVDRTKVSVRIKLKRELKKNGNYNAPYRDKKYKVNGDFMEYLNPNSVLDAYASSNPYYNRYNDVDLTTNDINDKFDTDYNMDAHNLLCYLYYKNNKYDLVDLDPFGSAFDCFDLAIKMARDGLIITFGEMGHKRFKRLDFVRRYYGIDDLDDFTVDSLISTVQDIGARNKKKLTVVHKKSWRNISRVYFKIDKLKITEQWDKEE